MPRSRGDWLRAIISNKGLPRESFLSFLSISYKRFSSILIMQIVKIVSLRLRSCLFYTSHRIDIIIWNCIFFLFIISIQYTLYISQSKIDECAIRMEMNFKDLEFENLPI